MTKTLNPRNTKKLPITDDIRKVYDVAFKKKLLTEKYREVARGISPWLNRLVSAYKERGIFPVTPAILGDFYKDPDDKVIAIIVGALCLNRNDTDVIMQECEVMRRIMGEHPYQDFFVNRQYTLMSLSDVMDNQLGGVGSMYYWQVSKLVDSLWDTWSSMGGKSLYEIFRDRVVSDGLKPYNAFTTMVNMDFVRTADYRINLALMALCDTDGMSYRLWDIGGSTDLLMPPVEPQTAEYVNMRSFQNVLLSGCVRDGFLPVEVANLVALRKPTDLWYAYHAYKLIYRSKGVGAYMRRYQSQMRNNSTGSNNREQLRLMEPGIRFE